VDKYLQVLGAICPTSTKFKKAMVLKLYGVSYASGGTSLVAMVLAEKQVPFELVPIDIDNGEQKRPDHVAKNPFGQVPVIVSTSRLSSF
jgi:glutathione S-transferase